ncbi:tRNA1(Val) (adenine(37)-N6)-methyltransferase [Thermosyntropha sp.]|uniref:tRNA1(Val) (adenine(37)-N6)-methyltransferase n=1 Tax=Thermosyntropha sp. TaxID=2740820 RepID=UPI0025EEF531|nr:tRNA1(Val) (adenine(37)-N6)-methyltransferase [Thermosyntropha sp.]MBO8159964.1 tRNA1(Val) (adenine(37)-N6)-methyltransferase [Thermosyntropha sp.]
MWVKPDETMDDLIIGGLKIIQPQKGYRFSIDAVLLAHFCSIDKANLAVDLGTGSGVIPLILTQRKKDLKIKGIEIQEKMAERAERSVRYNQLQDRIEVIKGDVKNIKELIPASSAELVVCNPPFFKENEGFMSKDEDEAVARHEIKVKFGDIVRAAAYILKPKGAFAFVQRADRFLEVVRTLELIHMAVSRVRWVHSYRNKPANLVLVEGRKNKTGGMKVLPPMIIYEEDGKYCRELLEIYGR